jgi:adenosylcobinamide kinase/adenosylcobinamide-phosphate guanylyltransferase
MPHEIILGGQRSGKSRHAEMRLGVHRARHGAEATALVVTAQPGDAEMRARIAQHRADREKTLPGLLTLESGANLANTLHRARESVGNGGLVAVDCLTMWLTGCLMPLRPAPAVDYEKERRALLEELEAPGARVCLVSNEIGLGVISASPETRAFVDTLGRLNQAVARHCGQMTLMVAGVPLLVRGEAR